MYHFQKIAEKSNILKKNESSTFEFTLVISKYMIRRPTGLLKKSQVAQLVLFDKTRIWENVIFPHLESVLTIPCYEGVNTP